MAPMASGVGSTPRAVSIAARSVGRDTGTRSETIATVFASDPVGSPSTGAVIFSLVSAGVRVAAIAAVEGRWAPVVAASDDVSATAIAAATTTTMVDMARSSEDWSVSHDFTRTKTPCLAEIGWIKTRDRGTSFLHVIGNRQPKASTSRVPADARRRPPTSPVLNSAAERANSVEWDRLTTVVYRHEPETRTRDSLAEDGGSSRYGPVRL